MKRIIPFVVLIIVGLSTTGCQYLFFIAAANEYMNMTRQLNAIENEKKLDDILDDMAIDLDAYRGSKAQHQAIDRFPLTGIKVDLDSIEMVIVQKMSPEIADSIAIASINQAFMSSELEVQLLDVSFYISEQPTEKGFFILSIESAIGQSLILEMFDEEGFEMTATNRFNVVEGQNYKGLDIKSLENGTYLFRLRDDAGKELVRSVDVQN